MKSKLFKGINTSIFIAFSGADYVVCLLQFHNDPLAAVNACYEGDRVIICPGHYVVDDVFYIADSVELEGKRFDSIKVLKVNNVLNKLCRKIYFLWRLVGAFLFFFPLKRSISVCRAMANAGWSKLLH